MLIAHLEPPNFGNEGDHVYRTEQPCRALGMTPDVTVISGTVLSPAMHDLVKIADVLILCEAADIDLLPIIEARDKSNRLNVFEINDDFTAIQPWNPTALFFREPINRALMYQLIEMSHCSQASSPEIERRFGHLSKPCAIFPNHLWQMPQRLPKPEPINIGWGGSVGHLEDIAWIIPALKTVLQAHPEVTLSIMGYEKTCALFDWVSPDQLSITTPGSLEKYIRFVQSLHIGLAPLKPTNFNRCRSDVKFLECAACGAAAVCSNLEPYSDKVQDGVTGLLFRDLEDLVKRIETLIADAPFRTGIQQAAYRYVETERLEKQHVEERLRFYSAQRNACFAEEGQDASPAEIARVIQSHSTAQQSAGSEHYSLAYGHLEKLIYAGLFHQSDDPDKARRCFSEAMELAPQFYLPYLYAGSVDVEAARGIEHLSSALARHPTSCAAAFHLGQRLRETGKLPAAQQAFEQSLRIAPKFAPAHECLGEIASNAQDFQRATTHFELALSVNRFYRTPATRLAVGAREHGDLDRAIRYLDETCSMAEDSWVDNLLLGQCYNEKSRFHEARPRLEKALQSAADPRPVMAQLAKAHLGCGDRNAAMQMLESVKQLAEPDPPI